MAVLAKLKNSIASDNSEDIPRIYDDPRFAEASDLLSAFRARLDRLQSEKQRLDLERHLANKAADPRSSTDTMLRTRLAALRALPPLAPTPAPATPSTVSPVIALGLAALAGKHVTPPPSHAEQIREISQQIDALHDAVREQTGVVDAAADELTFEFAQRLKPAWDALQIEMYRAAQELSRTARRVREFRAAITAAGIQNRPDVLAMPNVRAPLMLGDESQYDSEISGWRRILEQLGILK